jgi:Tfp pilus assembly protein PilN
MSDANLIPPGRLLKKQRKVCLYVWAAVCGLYAVLVAGGALVVHVAHADEDRRQNRQREAVAAEIEQGNRTMLDLRRQMAETNTLLETSKALVGQPDWSKLLVGLSAQVGDEIVLDRCQVTTCTADKRVVSAQEGPVLVSVPLEVYLGGCGHTLTLHGFGKSQESVSRFVLRLEGSGVFDLVRLNSSSRQTFLNGEAVAFGVECQF